MWQVNHVCVRVDKKQKQNGRLHSCSTRDRANSNDQPVKQKLKQCGAGPTLPSSQSQHSASQHSNGAVQHAAAESLLSQVQNFQLKTEPTSQQKERIKMFCTIL